MATRAKTNGDGSGITLRDVIVHMQHMEVRLTGDMKKLKEEMNQRFAVVDRRFNNVDRRFDDVDRQFKALNQDLFCVIRDTISIKKHVGMPIPKEW